MFEDFLSVVAGTTFVFVAAILVRIMVKRIWSFVLMLAICSWILRTVLRNGSKDGITALIVVSVFVVGAAIILPWFGRLKLIRAVKGLLILSTRKLTQIADKAAAVADETDNLKK